MSSILLPPPALIRAILAAGLADRFVPMDFPRLAKPTALVNAVGDLVSRGLAERVVVRCGVWHYRLADAERCRRIADGAEGAPGAGELAAEIDQLCGGPSVKRVSRAAGTNKGGVASRGFRKRGRVDG